MLSSVNSIHGAFEKVVAETPKAIAIEASDEKLTYVELNMRSNQLANLLKSEGVAKGDVVAIVLDISTELVVSILAVLKCGAVYLPIDRDYPVERIRGYLATAKAAFWIGDEEVYEQCAVNMGCIGPSSRQLSEPVIEVFESVECDGEDPAYILFTSGSTGKPKGVLVPHRAVLRLVLHTNYIKVSADDKILLFAPPVFDASTFELWVALLNGAVLVPYRGRGLDPNLLKKTIAEHKVSVLWLTAALFHLVADKCIEVLQPLRVLLAGGDVLNAKHINRVLDCFPGITVINGYGPTENTTFTCCHVMTSENLPGATVPIGQPIAGTTVHVLDKSMEPVKPGQVGELYAASRGVALGYLNEDSESSAFFHNQRIGPGLLYRTGDLVKLNANGDLEFVGRKDAQVKVRGFRVSIEEIASSIVAIEDVRDAVVVTKKYDAGDQLLIAYVQLSNDGMSAREIKQRLSLTLPEYMIPDRFVFDMNLPINVNGKVDRKQVQQMVDESGVEG